MCESTRRQLNMVERVVAAAHFGPVVATRLFGFPTTQPCSDGKWKCCDRAPPVRSHNKSQQTNATTRAVDAGSPHTRSLCVLHRAPALRITKKSHITTLSICAVCERSLMPLGLRLPTADCCRAMLRALTVRLAKRNHKCLAKDRVFCVPAPDLFTALTWHPDSAWPPKSRCFFAF